jgi:hypothetical protein
MSAFGYTRYGQKFGVAVRDGGARISDKLLEATDRLAAALFELGSCIGLERNYHFLYPFVGGTQVAHSFNLADPSLRRIAFEDDTTVTHNSFGITGPGNVQLFGFDNPGDPFCSWGIYQRSGVSADQTDFGAYDNVGPAYHAIVCRRATYGDTVYWSGINNSSGYIVVANSNPQGFYTSMRNPASGGGGHLAYKNGVNVGSQSTGEYGNSQPFYLFGGNSHNIAFCYLTKGYAINGVPYTHQMNASFYQIVQKFQTWLGRAV